MEMIKWITNDELEMFRIIFSRGASPDVHVTPLRAEKRRELRSWDDVSLKHDYMHYLWVASREDAKHKTR